MTPTAILLFASVLLLPIAALFALRWAGRSGQFAHQEKAALLPFDEEEPVGVMTDKILGVRKDSTAVSGQRPETTIRNSLA